MSSLLKSSKKSSSSALDLDLKDLNLSELEKDMSSSELAQLKSSEEQLANLQKLSLNNNKEELETKE